MSLTASISILNPLILKTEVLAFASPMERLQTLIFMVKDMGITGSTMSSAPSNIVADEVVLSPGDTVKVMNNYLQLVVSYKGKWICDRTIQSKSFVGTAKKKKAFSILGAEYLSCVSL